MAKNANNETELDYLCSRPDHQRQDIASMLVRSGIEVADRLGLDILLVAMGRGACDLYRKLGFELLEQRSQDLNPYGADDLYETFFLRKRPSQGSLACIHQITDPARWN